MLHGFNWYSNAVNAADIIYLGYLGEYGAVLRHAVITAAYTGLHYSAAYIVAAPQMTFLHSAAVACYSAYSSISNLYSLYKEYGSDDWFFKSNAAYAAFGWLLHSSLGKFNNDHVTERSSNADVYLADDIILIEHSSQLEAQ